MRYEHGDRVVVLHPTTGKMVKTHVCGHNTKLQRVSVTLVKGGPIHTFLYDDVFPLYRPSENGILPLFLGESKK